METDDRQFGFKRKMCCANAIFVVRSTTDYFVHRGSNSVYAAALDVSKAYDSVNHRKMFSALRVAGVSTWVILMLDNWYSKMFVAVRWGNSYSHYFRASSDVR